MLNIILTIIVFVGLFGIWIMLFDSNRFVVKKHEICDKRIEKPFRAVLLSDLHNKQYGKDNEKLFLAIKEANPDVCFIAGDIITASPGEKTDVAEKFIETLAKDFPVFYGNGNHEQRIKLYPNEYGDMNEKYGKILEKAGISPLVNEKRDIENTNVSVYGVEIDREYYKRFKTPEMDASYLNNLLGNRDEDKYTILIAHNPIYFPQYARWGADLVLSGHVHGGIVRIPFWGKGVISTNFTLFPQYDGGVFHEAGSTMILSRGLGTHTIPVRMFNPAELIIIDFIPEK